MEPTAENYPATPGGLADAMLELEPADSALGRMRDDLQRKHVLIPLEPTHEQVQSALENPDEEIKSFCEKLKALSMAQLSESRVKPALALPEVKTTR